MSNLALLIYTINNNIQSEIAPFLKDKNISFSEGQVLIFLGEEPSPSQEYIVGRLGMKKSFVSQLISSLKKKELVVVNKDKRDKRNNEIYLSPIGKIVSVDFQNFIEKYNNEIIENLSEYNKTNLDLSLRNVLFNIKKRWKTV